MPTETRLALAYRFKEFEVEKAKERQVAGVKIEQPQEQDTLAYQWAKVVDNYNQETATEVVKGKTLEIIAQKAGVSRATAEQYDAIQRKGTDEYKTEIKNTSKSL